MQAQCTPYQIPTGIFLQKKIIISKKKNKYKYINNSLAKAMEE